MLKLREYTPEDAGLVASGVTDEWTLRVWSAACYPAFPVSGSQINALYQSAREKEPSFRPLMAEEDGVPVAHMIVQYVDAAHTTVHFGFVIVDPACRGKGMGSRLLEQALALSYGEMGGQKAELIVVLSFTSLLFAVPFGAFWVFLITAVLAALLDSTFVLLQRYNRPRMVRLMEKQKRGRYGIITDMG